MQPMHLLFVGARARRFAVAAQKLLHPLRARKSFACAVRSGGGHRHCRGECEQPAHHGAWAAVQTARPQHCAVEKRALARSVDVHSLHCMSPTSDHTSGRPDIQPRALSIIRPMPTDALATLATVVALATLAPRPCHCATDIDASAAAQWPPTTGTAHEWMAAPPPAPTPPPLPATLISNVLGDHMVLQRAPASSVIWGFDNPGASVATDFNGAKLGPVTGQCAYASAPPAT
jgi:hypothetical protein